jgi:hypothetical protein
LCVFGRRFEGLWNCGKSAATWRRLPPADGKVKTPVLGSVCMPLLPGLDYIVFLYADNVIRGPGEGTRPIFNIEDPQEKHRLEKLRDLREAR